MNNSVILSKSARTWLFILAVSAIFWLGAINVRFIIGNELITFDEFNFRTGIPPDEENMIFKMVSNSSILIIITQITTFIAALVFAFKSKIKIKENGWYLMCLILFFAFTPVEFITSYIDLKFILLFAKRPANHDQLLKLFGERLGFFKGVPWIALLSYYTAIAIAVFRPLSRTQEQIANEKKQDSENAYKYYLHEDDDLTI